MKDPIVEEVRQTRIKFEQECKNSGMSYKDQLLSIQKEFENRLVMPMPRNSSALETVEKYEDE